MNGLYEVSNLGRVRSLNREITTIGKNQHTQYEITKKYKGKNLKIITDNKGYNYVSICADNKKVKKMIHRLVAEAFISNPENKPQINHISGIKTDNRVENLEWCTCQENIKHAFKTGLCKNQMKHIYKLHTEHQKQIEQYTLDGVYIKKWNSIKEAENTLNIGHHIGECCRGERKTAGGYKWKFAKRKENVANAN